MGIKDWVKKQKQVRMEEQGFRNIMAPRIRAAGRRAYATEATKVAEERARARARQPSIFQTIVRAAAAPRRRVAPVRRTRRRYVAPVRRVTPPTATSSYQPFSTDDLFRLGG